MPKNLPDPLTTAGKFRAARNTLRHGLCSGRYIISTEDEAVFRAYSRERIKHNQPANPNEFELVETR